MNCPRYANIRISNFVNKVDETSQMQFAAMLFELDRKLSCIVYRGTDDSLVGWREDFNMSFMTCVPSQQESVHYLQQVAMLRRGKIILCGHSKGGNLAVYAAMHVRKPLRNRILQIYNNDGPGFTQDMIVKERYQELFPKIRTFLPESSIVGMLFERSEKYEIVKSTQKGLKQHDAGTWEIERNHFVYANNVSPTCKIIDESLKAWIASLDAEQKKIYVESIFGVLDSMGIKTVNEFFSIGLKGFNSAFRTFSGMDSEVKQKILEITKILFEITGQNLKANLGSANAKDSNMQ